MTRPSATDHPHVMNADDRADRSAGRAHVLVDGTEDGVWPAFPRGAWGPVAPERADRALTVAGLGLLHD
jgi:hypothetical protein